MSIRTYQHVIVGAGLAGVSAIEGIRERDPSGTILLIGAESHAPYDRPPLSKKLWTGKKTVADIALHPAQWYAGHGVESALGSRVLDLDAARHTLLLDQDHRMVRYGKLLLATGGIPRTLNLPGSDLPEIFTYRTLDDYNAIRGLARPGTSAVIIGSGFIGAEMAAALSLNRVEITMVYPENHLIPKVFPASLGRAVQDVYMAKGIRILRGQHPAAFEKEGDRIVTATDLGATIRSHFVIAGIGVNPGTELAARAGVKLANGVLVDERMASSDPDIFAAGDMANFVYPSLGDRMRLEHWDNAIQQGLHAGRSMAGAREPFEAMPYFFSDLFDFGFEAVGEVDARLDLVADWRTENETGVLYYLKDKKVRGVMMCNVWDKVDEARAIIREQKITAPEDLVGRIR
jgi:3-phenylpropionate/trans-cinnamate dioxygenase ferredoxin reductase component